MIYLLLIMTIIAFNNCEVNVNYPALPRAFGNRIIILVAFGDSYQFSNFSTTLRQLSVAFNCPSRHQLVTFYFGDILSKVECDYESSLVDCVNDRVLGDETTANELYEVRYFDFMSFRESFIFYAFLGIDIR